MHSVETLAPSSDRFAHGLERPATLKNEKPTSAAVPIPTSQRPSAHDRVTRADSSPGGTTRNGYDSLSSSSFRRYLAAIEPRSVSNVIADISASQHPTRSAVAFAQLCERYPKLREIDRQAIYEYARDDASVAMRRPTLMQPVFDQCQRELHESRMIGKLVASLGSDGEVTNFARLAAPEFHNLPAIVKHALWARIKLMHDESQRDFLEEMLLCKNGAPVMLGASKE